MDSRPYHPAVVAQKAATLQILSGGRFRLGLGAGESLNEQQEPFFAWASETLLPALRSL